MATIYYMEDFKKKPEKAPRKIVGGVKAAAEMISSLDAPARQKLLARVAAQDPKLAEQIEKEMFVFEDLLKLSDPEIQQLLKEIARPRLVLALRTASEELKTVLYRNMSETAATLLKEEVEAQGKQRLALVLAAQAEMIEVAKKVGGR